MRDTPLYSVLSMTALAAEEKGALTAVDGNHITGWLKDNAKSDETAAVELHIYKDGGAKAAKVITVPEESYSEEAGKSYGDGCRAFDYKISWEEIGGTTYKVEACLVTGDEKTLLAGSLEYKPAPEALKKTESTSEEIGPGIPKKEEKPVEETFEGYKKESPSGSSRPPDTVGAVSVPAAAASPIPVPCRRQITPYQQTSPYFPWEQR